MKTLNRLAELWKKNKQLVSYLFFGVCTTLINTVSYGVLYEVLDISNVISTVIAWLVAVIFAFVTNKLWVFESRSTAGKDVLPELISFFGCRLATGVLDVVIMFVAVDMMQQNSVIWKLISNVLVIVINYVAGKWVIFKEKK